MGSVTYMEKAMAPHSSVLAWRISGTGEPGGLPVYGVTQSWTRLKRLSSSNRKQKFYKSNFSESMTIFGTRLTPSVGISVSQGNSLAHRLMAGVDVMKDFGDSLAAKDLLREVTLYYNMEKRFKRNEFTMYAGIFPRKTMEGRWGEAFFSDSLTFYDNNLEGLLLKLRRPKAYFELGADWMGLTGEYRRERFMIFTSGQGRILPYTHLGFHSEAGGCKFLNWIPCIAYLKKYK